MTKEKGHTMIQKTLHRKLKIEQHEPNLKPGWSRVFRKYTQFMLHNDLSCYSSCKPGYKSWMRNGPGSVYDKWKISVVIWDTAIP